MAIQKVFRQRTYPVRLTAKLFSSSIISSKLPHKSVSGSAVHSGTPRVVVYFWKLYHRKYLVNTDSELMRGSFGFASGWRLVRFLPSQEWRIRVSDSPTPLSSWTNVKDLLVFYVTFFNGVGPSVIGWPQDNHRFLSRVVNFELRRNDEEARERQGREVMCTARMNDVWTI